MASPTLSTFRPSSARPRHRTGVTLVEVLVAIFIMGVGLLSQLVLFPLGAMEMAKAVRDDRAVKIAADAVVLGEIGDDLIAQTCDFAQASLTKGSVDRGKAKALRLAYEGFAARCEDVEARLYELRPRVNDPKARSKVDALLEDIQSIQGSVERMAGMLKVVASL